MIVLSLFDGMSCGRLALERAGIEVENYYASEIDKYAVTVSKKNWPDIIQIGDVTQVSYKDGVLYTQFGSYQTEIDMVIGGSPCFVAGTQVQTISGFKSIENILVGDFVLTHTNTYKKVLKVGGDKSKPTISVKAQGMIPTETTANHPYYFKSKTDAGYTRPSWKKAGELLKGDYIAFPINSVEENPLQLTEQECLVLGRYIADGHTRKDYRKEDGRSDHRYWQLIISVGASKCDIFESKYLLKHSLHKHTESTMRAVFSSKRLVEIAEDYCGIGSSNKQFPQVLLNLPIKLLAKVLEGYSDGDGCFTKNGWQATTVSKLLALSLSQAIAKVHSRGISMTFCVRPKTTVIQGRVVNQQDTYLVRSYKTEKHFWHIDDGFIWYPVKSINATGANQDVFNIEVEQDNSYTANGFVVHNCQSFSVAGNGKGFDGSSGLFYEWLRILREVSPKYFLLENVCMKKEWENVITQEVGVAPIMINSALVSAQNRKRLYWTNIEGITQPQDMGITLPDILECDVVQLKQLARGFNKGCIDRVVEKSPTLSISSWQHNNFFKCINTHETNKTVTKANKAYCLTANYHSAVAWNSIERKQRSMVVIGESDADGANIYGGKEYRKLTPIECERLQTLPDDYTKSVSNNQRYKMIGNGWTVDVIAHIFSFIKE